MKSTDGHHLSLISRAVITAAPPGPHTADYAALLLVSQRDYDVE